MADYPANNYLGSRFLFQNLLLMPEKIAIPSRDERTRDALFKGLDGVLPEAHLNKVWEMISKRWDYYEELYRRQQG